MYVETTWTQFSLSSRNCSFNRYTVPLQIAYFQKTFNISTLLIISLKKSKMFTCFRNVPLAKEDVFLSLSPGQPKKQAKETDFRWQSYHVWLRNCVSDFCQVCSFFCYTQVRNWEWQVTFSLHEYSYSSQQALSNNLRPTSGWKQLWSGKNWSLLLTWEKKFHT